MDIAEISKNKYSNLLNKFPELFSFVLITIVSLALEILQYIIPSLNYPMQLGLVII
jgi:transmembrane protein 17